MKFIIHRGITSSTINENSYLSIKRALQDKQSMGVEFDIRLTKDKQIVLSHNSILSSSTIENMTYKEILKHKYLTTLEQILSIKTDKILLIDIKTNNNYKLFANTLLTKLQNVNQKIYLVSFDKKIINYLKRKTPIPKGRIYFHYLKDLYPIILLNYKLISNRKIKKIHKDIFLWTIPNIKELPLLKSKFSNIEDYYLIINKRN